MKSLIFLLYIIILTPIATASVQIDTSDILRITNADINFSSTQTFNNLDIGGTYIDFTGNPFYIIPTGQLNVTITTWNTAGDYHKVWTEDSTNPATTTAHTIGDFPANTFIDLFRDGVLYDTFLSDASGQISFNYAGGYSSHQFDALISSSMAPAGLVAGCTSATSDVNVAFNLIGVLLIVFAAFLIVTGILTQNPALMVGGVGATITGAVMILVGYFIVATLPAAC